MSGEIIFHNGNVCVPVFCFNEGIGEGFFSDLGIDASHGELAVGDRTVQLELVHVLENSTDDVESAISKADAVILLVRFLDRVSMTRVKDVHHLIHSETLLPKEILIMREQKENQFKISCSYCGQKLWVRDNDVGRRGNCPRCRKTFIIPAQKACVTSALMLTDAEPLMVCSLEDGSCKKAIETLVNRIISMEDSVKSSTMKIELPPEDKASGI